MLGSIKARLWYYEQAPTLPSHSYLWPMVISLSCTRPIDFHWTYFGCNKDPQIKSPAKISNSTISETLNETLVMFQLWWLFAWVWRVCFCLAAFCEWWACISHCLSPHVLCLHDVIQNVIYHFSEFWHW